MSSLRLHLAAGLFIGTLLLAMEQLSAASESDAFLRSFIANYQNQDFFAQGKLVEENKERVPGAVEWLLAQAMAEERSFEERMYLLNIASALAYMHKHRHGDDGPLAKVDPVIKQELEKEKALVAEMLKWKAEERFLGNFVMKRHQKAMDEKGLAPVLYPHWQHRIFYECKVCHNAIFRMKRWTNDISHEAIDKGEQCGVCHNGSRSFDARDEKQCDRCHIAGTAESIRLGSAKTVDYEKIKQAAGRIGAQWRPENLPDGKLPLDRFQFIDWLAMKRSNAFVPVVSLDEDFEERTRDNKILFVTRSDFVDNVLFDHKVHSDWINCSVCHPALFAEELGGNEVKMREFSKGRYCGHCHGKVSFTFADCKRCHRIKKGEDVENALQRKAG